MLMSYSEGLDELVPDQSQVRLDQKNKQRSFQESPLYINGNLFIGLRQGGKF